MFRRTTLLFLSSGLACPAFAGEDHDCESCRRAASWSAASERVPFDESSGRDLRQFPPHRFVDAIHMRLALTIPDMNQPRALATQELTLRAIADPIDEIDLDARLLRIQGVQAEGRVAEFTHDGERLTIRFDPPLEPGRPVVVVVRYEIEDPPYGLTWTPESGAWPGRAAQLHTQGQPETNSYWFPCHDFPNERLTTEFVVTVPESYLVSSNGRLVSRERADSAIEGLVPGNAYETFHWLQDKPHVNYLVSLIVGRFDVVDVGSPALPMPVYAPVGRGGDVRDTYGRTADMVRLFESITGQAYPWDRYAQLIVWNFGAGGMENTSATTMFDNAIIPKPDLVDHDLDGLISHELAHQWYGDLVTCKSWEHVWLNEGFATYFSHLWFEHRDGRDDYLLGVRGNYDGLIANDKAQAPSSQAMCSKQYDDPWETFRRAANPYGKGASVLHMLRSRLGDRVFFEGIRLHTARAALGNAETSDLRQAMEDASGESLEQFFHQWCFRPGVPRLEITTEWDEATRRLEVAVSQKQPIDGPNPAFEFDLPVWVKSADGAEHRLTVAVSGRLTTARFDLGAEPRIIAFDPELSVLADLDVRQPTIRWINQLAQGPGIAARVQAARALGAVDDDPAGDALLSAALDPLAHRGLRRECIGALAKRADAARLEAVAREVRPSRAEPDVRVRLVDAIAEALPKLEAADPDSAAGEQRRALKRAVVDAADDPALTVRAAAIRAIGTLKLYEQMPLVLAAVDAESHGDALRQAGLDALASLDLSEGLLPAIRMTWPGVYNRTRPVAVKAVVALAHHNPDAAFTAIVPMLDDRERRAWESGGQALVDLKDPRGVAELSKLAARLRDPRDRAKAEEWAIKLREATTTE